MTPLELLEGHRSIRRFKSDPVPDDVLRKILMAATRASTSGNMQVYSIVVTRDVARRARLWELHFRQDMIQQAPVLLTFLVDWHRMSRWCRSRDADPGYDNMLSFAVGAADALIAAQNAALAAEAQGLGICYLGTTWNSASALIEFFNCPPGTFPVTTLVVGTPDEEPALRDRLPLSAIVHEERYQDFDEARLDDCYREREVAGWNRYQGSPRLAERIRASGVTNLAQIYTTLKYTRQNNVTASRALLAALERQGFLNHGHADRDECERGVMG